MNIRERMNPAYAKLRGGYFSSYHALGEKGVTLMGWADPFYPDPCIPEHVTRATIEHLKSGLSSHYTMPIGDLELRREVSKKLLRVNGIEADPEKEIIITPGSDIGLYYALAPFIIPGQDEEVMVPDPSYANNFIDIELVGAKCVRIPLREENGFQFDIRDYEAKLTPKSKVILLTQPNNPTTTVFRRENLEKLARFAITNDLVVVVDQAFESTIFDGIEFVNIATLPGMWERTVNVFSISKGMGLSGYRVGYVVASEDVIDVLYGGAVNVLGATNTAAQAGAIAALRNDSFIEEYNKVHDFRRKVAFEIFNSIPGVTCLMPESGFYAWVNISRLGTSAEIVDYLVEDAKVAVNNGAVYGESGEGYIRIIIGALRDNEKAIDALRRVEFSLRKLSSQKGII